MSSTFHHAAHPSWQPSRLRTMRDIALPRRALRTRRAEKKVKDKRMPIISYREVIAAWALIALVGAAVFGSDFLWRDAATNAACPQHVVAPEGHVPGTHVPGNSNAYDHGERLDRLDWDRDLNASGSPASRQTATPCPL